MKRDSSKTPPEWREKSHAFEKKGCTNGKMITAFCFDSSQMLIRTQTIAPDGCLLLAQYKHLWHLEQSVDTAEERNSLSIS